MTGISTLITPVKFASRSSVITFGVDESSALLLAELAEDDAELGAPGEMEGGLGRAGAMMTLFRATRPYLPFLKPTLRLPCFLLGDLDLPARLFSRD